MPSWKLQTAQFNFSIDNTVCVFTKLGFNNQSHLSDVCMNLWNILKLLAARYHQIRARARFPIAISTPALDPLCKLLLKAKGPFGAGAASHSPRRDLRPARRRGPAQPGKFPAAETTCAACRESAKTRACRPARPGPRGPLWTPQPLRRHSGH